MKYSDFQTLLRARGEELYRDMPWRRDTRPYYILVSELMLQQTQVARVTPKFQAFIEVFPDIESLARATLADVLKQWVGLGYNRRAKYLHQAAQQIVEQYGGILPKDIDKIKSLPGIGPATAGAIMVYAFNEPIIFIETNVRTVYFHYFFDPDEKISDAQLAPLIETTIDQGDPRRFYWALMDYGSWLKQTVGKGSNTRSVHYKKQSKFKGSIREVRGRIIRLLGDGDMAPEALEKELLVDERFSAALSGLMKDGLVVQSGDVLHLTK